MCTETPPPWSLAICGISATVEIVWLRLYYCSRFLRRKIPYSEKLITPTFAKGIYFVNFVGYKKQHAIIYSFIFFLLFQSGQSRIRKASTPTSGKIPWSIEFLLNYPPSSASPPCQHALVSRLKSGTSLNWDSSCTFPAQRIFSSDYSSDRVFRTAFVLSKRCSYCFYSLDVSSTLLSTRDAMWF